MRAIPAQTSFTGGEMSPKVYGREDIARYAKGCAELQNFRLQIQGGAYRRPGTRYVAAARDSDERAHLIPFEFSSSVAYVLCLNNGYMRFFRDEGALGAPYEIAIPWAADDLPKLQHAQNADIMYFVHPDYWPRKLTRVADTSWTLADVAFVDGPYLPDNTTAITMQPSATTGSITITASASYFDAGMAPSGGERGAYIRILHGATWGYAQITGYTSATQVSATVLSTFGGTTAVTTWAEGAWSTYRGFPRAVTFFEQRLYLGGTSYQPQTVWGSAGPVNAGPAYEDMTPGVADDDAVNYTIASEQLNEIQWMAGRDLLFIGTTSDVYAAGSRTEPLTPTNVRIVPQASRGSSYYQPVRVSNAVLFVTRCARKLRELTYDFNDDSYRAPDITVLAEHLTVGGFIDLAYASDPDPIVYAVRNDGVLLGCLYDRDQDEVGWWREVIGGDGVVESVAVIPYQVAVTCGENASQVWVTVRRTIDGATARYIEYFTPKFDTNGADGLTIEDACFVDSSLVYSGAVTTTITGLDHLEGETVQILGNGAELPDAVVSGGEIELQESVTTAVVGLGYASTIKTLPGVIPTQDGTSQGRAKSWGRLKLRLHETVGLTINDRPLPIRSPLDLMDTAIPVFSGIRTAQLDGWSEEGQITMTQSRPLPATVLALFGVYQVEDV